MFFLLLAKAIPEFWTVYPPTEFPPSSEAAASESRKPTGTTPSIAQAGPGGQSQPEQVNEVTQ